MSNDAWAALVFGLGMLLLQRWMFFRAMDKTFNRRSK